MTNSNWKPVPHDQFCNFKMYGVFDSPKTVPSQCTCSGTRWHGYGERVGDLAGVLAFAQGMAWLGGEAVPVAYRRMVYSGTIERWVLCLHTTDFGAQPLYTHPPAAINTHFSS